MAEIVSSLTDIGTSISRIRLLGNAATYHLKAEKPILFMLGFFTFSIATASPQSLRRKSAYKWVAQDRLGRGPAHQFMGKDAETINISGVIYPYYEGGLGQMELLRAMAELGKWWVLVDGRLINYGKWFINSIEHTDTIFNSDGSPKKMEFVIGLTEYGVDDDGIDLPL